MSMTSGVLRCPFASAVLDSRLVRRCPRFRPAEVTFELTAQGGFSSGSTTMTGPSCGYLGMQPNSFDLGFVSGCTHPDGPPSVATVEVVGRSTTLAVAPSRSDGDARIAVVIATRNRRDELRQTLDRLLGYAGARELVVVDNASDDGTADLVRRRHPDVRLMRLEENAGAHGRSVGVAVLDTMYVAFSDDDSWWAPGALRRAADVLDAHPRLGLIAGRIIVEPEGRVDPTCVEMATSPLEAAPDLPGPSVLGFLACGAVVRRQAFVECGGFHARFGTGGEEELLAIDLAEAGWGLAYLDDVVAHHRPSRCRDAAERRRRLARNRVLVGWLRRPLGLAVRRTLAALRSTEIAQLPRLLPGALAAAPWLLRERRRVGSSVEAGLRRLEDGRGCRAGVGDA
jgi:N-acetylglucosaminyl-diphospho-decaprenol L-rhamnosyltransferase